MPNDIVPLGPDPLERAQAIAKVSLELAELEVEARRLLAEEEDLTGEHGTALVAQNASSLVEVEARLQQTRGVALRTKLAIEAKRAEMETLFAAQIRQAREASAPLVQKLKRLEEGLWTLSLYSGDKEDIVCLADGEPAPADTPITVRQLVLAMDEECAVAAEEGGIDALSIDEFDAWLCADPAHLAQVCPEEKAIVALVPRWDAKDYDDPWKTMEVSKANRQTYFLIRNGAVLYRYVTDFIAGPRLVPTVDEFTACFRERSYDPVLHDYVETELTPGSRAWQNAEERADAIRRHYMRVGLVLQGLVDRTPILRPLAHRVNFLGTEDYDAGRIVIVTNAERALTDGAESFRAWQRRLMGELRPGMRVIGAFQTYRSREEWDIYPSGASLPRSYVPHVVSERLDDGRLKILYERTDTVAQWVPNPARPGWLHLQERAPERRASCTFFSDSELVLPFDLVEVADVERFLRSRLERRGYLQMFPLLKATLRAKREEALAEAPFRQMLAGVLARENGGTVAEAEASVPDLVSWWKLTNRNHRPLIGSEEENAKAVRMILAEHRRRAGDAGRTLNVESVARLRGLHPEALLIARKRDGDWVVLEPQDDGDAFVVETLYGARGKEKRRKEWQLVGSRAARWSVAHASAAWESWDVMASRSDHFSGPEIAAATERLLAEVATGTPVAVLVEDNTHGDRSVAPKVAVLTFDFDAVLLDEEHPLTGRRSEPQAREVVRRLRRGAGGEVALVKHWSDHYPGGKWPGWDTEMPRRENWRRLFLDADVAERAQDLYDRYQVIAKRARDLQEVVYRHERRVAQQWKEREEEHAYADFLERYADPELWEAHRKTLKLTEIVPGLRDFGAAESALRLLVESGQVLDGLSIAEVLERARVLCGFEADDELPYEIGDLTV